MKKAIALFVSIMLCLALTACAGSNENANTQKSEEPVATATPTPVEKIELTAANINDYVQFVGEFIDGEFTMGAILNWATATLSFRAYPIAAGKFNNVDITLISYSDDSAFTYMNDFGDYWHLTGDDEAKEIRINFKLGVDGKYSQNYSVECLNNTDELGGSSNFEIVSVSGTFIPD